MIARLNEGTQRKLILVSAPAGFGKTTLVGEWAAGCMLPVAWLSLDERDNDPSSFLTYLVAAVRTIAPGAGEGVLAVLQSPQPPSTEAVLTTLVNELTAVPDDFVLVLDDYHVLDSNPVDDAVTLLLEHLPPRMHLVIATREDPRLPLARLRARGQLTELRAADLRFTPAEAAEFLRRATGLDLSTEDIEALETRTEGWIAGLQMAAIALQGVTLQGTAVSGGPTDAAGFIRSFTGSHRFVLDYLLEEVLHREPHELQAFLLRTSILDRLCGPLCDAVLRSPAGFGEATLQAIERANLFIVPLDDERRWYRYHHLFADLLRKQLGQSLSPGEITELHSRASDVVRAQRPAAGGLPSRNGGRRRGARRASDRPRRNGPAPPHGADAHPGLAGLSAQSGAGRTTPVVGTLGHAVAHGRADHRGRGQAASGREGAPRCRTRRGGPRPHRADSLRPGHPGAHPL